MNSFDIFPKNGYGFIYKYTSPSGKSYIGQTIRSLKERARNSKGEGYIRSPYFFHAIQKYGFENFQFEILGEYPIGQLDEQEILAIKKFETLVPKGYNIKTGGNQEHNSHGRERIINQFDLQGNFIRQYSSIVEAAKDNDTLPQAISSVLSRKRKQHNGFIYRYFDESKPEPTEVKKIKGRITAQYTLDGEFIQFFKSANEAGRSLGKDGRNIRLVCEGKRMSAYGFKWKYLD